MDSAGTATSAPNTPSSVVPTATDTITARAGSWVVRDMISGWRK
jgi:hypothetical protein